MRRIALFFLVLFVFACAEKVIEPPEDLIPKQRMIDILHDLALLNATRTSFRPVLENKDIDMMGFLFNKYEIDSLQFAKSDRYYASKPLEYQAIYEEVEARIAKQRKILEDANKRKNDSIRNIQELKKDIQEPSE